MSYTYTITGPGKRTDAFDARLNRINTHQYEMRTDDPTLDEFTASVKFTALTGIGRGYAHPSNSNAFCIGFRTTENPDSAAPNFHWQYEVSYSTNPDSSVAGIGTPSLSGPAAPAVAGQQQGVPMASRVDSPTGRAIDVKQTGSPVILPIYKDRNGDPWCNTVGDQFSSPLTRESATVKYTISINRLTLSSSHYAYQGCVNDRAVTIPIHGVTWGVETLKFKLLEVDFLEENGVRYFRHNYTIEAGPYWTFDGGTYLGWVKEVANMGKRFYATLPSGADDIINYDQDTGQPIVDDVFLDASGYRLDTGLTGWESSIHFIRRHPDFLMNMALLWV